jgi:IPT/TIG domain
MLRIALGLLLGVALVGSGCGYSSRNYMNGTGMPAITQLSPNTTAAGGPDFTLTVVGTAFGTDSVVYWGTATRPTTYVDTMHVTAAITAADIMNAAMVQVYVRSAGANTKTLTFTIQ